MDLNIKGQLFVVTGASSGLGNAVARSLLGNEASIVAVARRAEELRKLEEDFPGKVTTVCGSVIDDATIDGILKSIDGRSVHGVFVNAGGPPAASFEETDIEQWDEAYQLIVRWKVQLVKALLPIFKEQAYGRIIFSESSTVKQPIENLVLSNSMRMAIAGAAKTLALEVASEGVTVNLMGPGYHDTSAVDRLFKKSSEVKRISVENARQETVRGIPVGRIGNPDDFASLACWLLSPLSGFVTGQVWSLDGGTTRYSLG